MAGGAEPKVAWARYFDGRSSQAEDVLAVLTEDELLITDSARQPIARWPLSAVRAMGERGDAVQALAPDEHGDERLMVSDQRLVGALLRACPRLYRRGGTLRGLRTVALWSGVAAVSVVVLVFGIVPALAERLAPMIPPEREVALGRTVAEQVRDILGYMNEDDTRPAYCTAGEGEAALAAMTDRLGPVAEMPYPLDVRVLDHGMTNAFALPGGRIVLFRGLIDAAESPEEVAGVLAHEIGHVVNRDPTTGVLRSAGTAGIVGLLFGDFFGAGIAVAVGNTVLDASYQREAETRADEHAYTLLNRADLPVAPLAGFFERLKREAGDHDDSVLRYVASHPGLGGRAERAAAADEVGDATFDPVLSGGQWKALKGICSETEADARKAAPSAQ